MLSERERRPESVQKLLDESLDLTRGAARETPTERERKEFQSLIGSLEALTEQFITRAVRDLVLRHVGDETFDGLRADRFVARAYDARSHLTHEGTPPDDVDIANLGGELRRLVQAVIGAAFDAL